MSSRELGVPVGPEVREIPSTIELRALWREEILAGINIINNSLGVHGGERVLVITDTKKESAAYIFSAAARRFTPNVRFLSMVPRSRSAEEPPPEIAQALLESDVFCLVTTYSLSHTRARQEACERGGRGFGMATPGLDLTQTIDLITRTLTADLSEIVDLTNRVADALVGTSLVRVTTDDGGTDVSFSIREREIHRDDGNFKVPGKYGNQPCGEVFAAIVEGTANGVITVDGNALIGNVLDQPIRLTIQDGSVVRIEGGQTARDFQNRVGEVGRLAANVGEFGIGTNPKATLTSGVAVEVEKKLETVHFGFGSNATFGGRISVTSHCDGAVLNPSVTLDGKRPFMQRGKFVF